MDEESARYRYRLLLMLLGAIIIMSGIALTALLLFSPETKPANNERRTRKHARDLTATKVDNDHWGMPRKDAGNTAYLADGPQPPLEEVWSAEDKTLQVLSDGTIYAIGNRKRGTLYALDAETGKTEWTSDIKNTGHPVVADGIVYVSGGGRVSALDTQSGQKKWALDAHGTLEIIAGKTVFLDSYKSEIEQVVLALNATTGEKRWANEAIRGWQSVRAASSDIVFMTSGSDERDIEYRLFALDAETGKQKWSRAKSFWPIISGSTVYTFGPIDDGPHLVYALNARTGEERWRAEGPRYHGSSAAVSPDTIYVQDFDHEKSSSLYALDAQDGRVKWKFLGVERHMSPVATRDTVYVFHDIKNEKYKTRVYALDSKTGNTKWISNEMLKYDAKMVLSEDYLVVSYFDSSRERGKLWVYQAAEQ